MIFTQPNAGSETVVVYTHHADPRSAPLISLWYSQEECRRLGISLRFVRTWSPRLGIRAVLRSRHVLFNGVNCLCYGYAPIALQLAKRLGKKIAVYWHETEWIIDRVRRPELVTRVLRDRDIVHFHVAERGAKLLVEKYGALPDRVRVLQNMAHVRAYSAYEAHLGFVPGFFVGAAFVDECKDPWMFLEVARRVVEKRPDARFVWLGAYGGGRYSFEAVKNRISQMGLQSRVFFPGEVFNAVEVMALAEAVLLTSRSEGSPTVLMEALALGKKAVAFDVGGVAEVLGKLGRVIPPGDVDSFVYALLDQSDVADPELCGQRRQRYGELYTPEAFARRFAEALKWWDEVTAK